MSNQTRLNEVQSVIRGKLTPLSQKYFEIVATHWGKQSLFHESFIDELMTQPEKCKALLLHCEYATRKHSHAKETKPAIQTRAPYMD